MKKLILGCTLVVLFGFLQAGCGKDEDSANNSGSQTTAGPQGYNPTLYPPVSCPAGSFPAGNYMTTTTPGQGMTSCPYGYQQSGNGCCTQTNNNNGNYNGCPYGTFYNAMFNACQPIYSTTCPYGTYFDWRYYSCMAMGYVQNQSTQRCRLKSWGPLYFYYCY